MSNKGGTSSHAKRKDNVAQTHTVQHTLRATQKVKQPRLPTQVAEDPAVALHGKDAKLAQLLGASAQISADTGAGSQQQARDGTVKGGDKGKGKAQGAEPAVPGRKQVFRPVLSSPYTVNWPTLPTAISNNILHALLKLLAHPEFAPHVRAGNLQNAGAEPARRRTKRKRGEKQCSYSVTTGQGDHNDASTAGPSSAQRVGTGTEHSTPAPWLVPGINSVTRALELRVRALATARSKVRAESTSKSKSKTDSRNSHQKNLGTRGPAKGIKARTHPPTSASNHTQVTTGNEPDPSTDMALDPTPGTTLPSVAKEAVASGLASGQGSPEAAPVVRILFVCRHDVDPPALVAHLPLLSCAANAVSSVSSDGPKSNSSADASDPPSLPLLLVPLPQSSEQALAPALGLRRCAVLALTSAVPEALLAPLLKLITSPEVGALEPPRAPWLETALSQPTSLAPSLLSALGATSSGRKQDGKTEAVEEGTTIVPVHIKHIRTFAPVDMNGMKARKKAVRTARADKRRARTKEAQKEKNDVVREAANVRRKARIKAVKERQGKRHEEASKSTGPSAS